MARNRDEYKPFFPKKKIIALAVIVIVAVAAVVAFGSSTTTIPAGNKGVLLNFGEVVGVLDPGFHWISPIGQTVVLVNTQTQSATADENAASSDLQEVSASVTVNYQIDPAFVKEVYTTLRDQYQSRVILPAMQDGLKASTAKYQASELITRREDAKNSFQDLLQQKLQQYHIIITSVSITNFQFSDQFQSAVDAKVTAEQNALAAENQLQVVQFQAQQQIIQAQAAANATIAKANGDATARIIAAQAQNTYQFLINQNLTQSYLNYLYLQTWNGQLPTFYGGELPIPFFNIGNTTTIPTDSEIP
jgi:regulator of protease activity HflC (stomatin/prohibitin superfamily)